MATLQPTAADPQPLLVRSARQGRGCQADVFVQHPAQQGLGWALAFRCHRNGKSDSLRAAEVAQGRSPPPPLLALLASYAASQSTRSPPGNAATSGEGRISQTHSGNAGQGHWGKALLLWKAPCGVCNIPAGGWGCLVPPRDPHALSCLVVQPGGGEGSCSFRVSPRFSRPRDVPSGCCVWPWLPDPSAAEPTLPQPGWGRFRSPRWAFPRALSRLGSPPTPPGTGESVCL